MGQKKIAAEGVGAEKVAAAEIVGKANPEKKGACLRSHLSLHSYARLTYHQYPCVCGILLKNCLVAPSPLDTQTAHCNARHCSFHPDINSHPFHPDVSHSEFCPPNALPYPDVSHPEFFSVDISSGCLTSGILLRGIPIRMSRIQKFSPPTFHPDVSHPEFFSADILRMSHIRNSIRPTFHFLQMSHIQNSVCHSSLMQDRLGFGEGPIYVIL
uniref:Uncharacterized protein n=1 Tax=Vitis vinifera TaxID=29760 RepID=A5BRI3_VITVI|nr:hypothetical protein VITISV_016177 [Vitis vinifera]